MHRFILFLILCLLAIPLAAQDAQELPSELYVLRNEGYVERFGLGTEGVRRVTPETEYVLDFRVAPDNQWLAYRSQEGLFLLDMYGTDQRQIEDNRASLPPVRGRGETMAWSPDSSALAYTTEYGGRVHFFAENRFVDLTTPGLRDLIWSPTGMFLAAEADEGVWWIFQRNGADMLLRAAIAGANGGDWFTSSEFLYAPIEGGLTILDFEGGNLQFPVLDASRIYYKPSVTDDGTVVAFVGEKTAAVLVQVLFEESGASALAIGAIALDLSSVRWAAGGFLLTGFQGGVLALINPLNASGFTLPVTSVSAYSWGESYPPLVASVPLERPAYFISQDLTGVEQVWILPSDNTRARTISPSSLDISEFAISPNGQRLAYVSNSSLWLFDIGGESEATEAVMLGINTDIAPAWGPDNETLYYRDVQADGAGIWRFVDGEASLFVPDESDAIYTAPQPALGVAAMLVHSADELALVDTTSGELRLLGITGTGLWQTGTQLLVEGFSGNDAAAGNGLFVLDANSLEQNPTLIIPLLGNLELLDYRVLENGTIRMLVQNSNPGELRVLDVQLGGEQPTLIANLGYLANPELSPDGTRVIGQRNPTGVLIAVDIASQTRQQIDVQAFRAPITGFIWD